MKDRDFFKKEKRKAILELWLLVVIAVVCIILSIIFTKAIVNADMPEWLKFWILTK